MCRIFAAKVWDGAIRKSTVHYFFINKRITSGRNHTDTEATEDHTDLLCNTVPPRPQVFMPSCGLLSRLQYK
jgi:hypothetical protein